MMILNKVVDYDKVNKCVIDIIKLCKIDYLPVDLNAVQKILSKEYNCRFIPYSIHMKKHNLSPEEMDVFAGSHDACCIYNASSNKYLIFYNDTDPSIISSRRFRWNIAHEIGHMVLKHNEQTQKSRICRSVLSDTEYHVFEDEAENFATLFLAHPVLLNQINAKTPDNIAKICDISFSAAKSVYRYLPLRIKFTKYSRYDNKILKCFFNFIHVKFCLRCHKTFIAKHSKYCIFCGQNRLTRGDLKMIYKTSIQLNEKNRCVKCPKCDNEEIDVNSHYCKICGTYIVQKCLGSTINNIYLNLKEHDEGCDCSHIPSNARFCPNCGGITSFNYQNILGDWEEEKSSYQSILEPEIKDLPF